MVLNDELASALQLSEANPSDEVSIVRAQMAQPASDVGCAIWVCGIIYHGQDISLALVALLTPATHDVKASLSEIYHLITRIGATSHLVRTWF